MWKFSGVNGVRQSGRNNKTGSPYDPPPNRQDLWTSAPGVNGWASYKVADSVTSHEAWGIGIYSVFLVTGQRLTRAIETPVNPNVHQAGAPETGGFGGITSPKPRNG